MPHVGSIIGGDDDERIQRLMRTLDHPLDEAGRPLSRGRCLS